MQELKTCPFCGSIPKTKVAGRYGWVECPRCGVRTPLAANDWAIAAWNLRSETRNADALEQCIEKICTQLGGEKEIPPWTRIAALLERERVLREALEKIRILAEASQLCGDRVPAVTAQTLIPLIDAALAQ